MKIEVGSIWVYKHKITETEDVLYGVIREVKDNGAIKLEYYKEKPFHDNHSRGMSHWPDRYAFGEYWTRLEAKLVQDDVDEWLK
jgi:hypothetical protein